MAMLIHDPINPTHVIQENDDERVPNSYVQSCSECCFERAPDGGPNVLGALQKQMMTRVIDNVHGHFEYLDCAHCPVPLHTDKLPAKTGDGRYIYWKNTDRRLTRGDLMKLELDSDPIDLLCDFRDK